MLDQVLDLAQRINLKLRKKHKTLAVAESCTGGLLSHVLTEIPKASEFFIMSVVSYSIVSKIRCLGINPDIINIYGVVSKETAEEMALGVKRLSGADYAISTTGNLGPTALDDKPVGLVYVSVYYEDGLQTRQLNLTGDRTQNKVETVFHALRFIDEVIIEA